MTVGDMLSRVRAVLGFSAEEMAGLLGVDGPRYDAWEHGLTEPPELLLESLATLRVRLAAFERAREELTTVGALRDVIEDKVRELLKWRPETPDRDTALALHKRNQQSVDDHQLLLRQAYGKVVRARDTDTGVEKTFRIAWGTTSWGALDIYPRNAPVIRTLLSARPGRSVLVTIPKTHRRGRPGQIANDEEDDEDDEREYEILEVSILWRHPGERLQRNLDNFFRLEYALDEPGHPRSCADELRDWVATERDGIVDVLLATPDEAAVEEKEAPPPLSPESRAALGERFFIDPLEAQEEAMAEPAEGHLLVEGVAGSGKTSIALGRSRHIFMQRTEEGDVTEFIPENAIGFVLSEQLVSYLERLVKTPRLQLGRMQIKSFFRLRQELLGASGRNLLVRGVRRVDAEGQHDDRVVGTAAWALAVEVAMVQALRDALASELAIVPGGPSLRLSPLVTPRHREVLQEPWAEVCRAVPGVLERATSLEGSLQRIDEARAVFANRLETLSPWDSPRYREDRRKLNQALRDATTRAFVYATRYFEAVASATFSEVLRGQLRTAGSSSSDEVDASVAAARQRAASSSLSNNDIDCILLIAHRAAQGYVGRDGARPIEHLGQLPHRIHVFIDEVQDFSEVQVRLMAAQADPRFHSVTAVGDFAQRLSGYGIENTSRSGLRAGEGRRMFLAWNKRQTAPLHGLSHAFRSHIYGDERACAGEAPQTTDERPFWLGQNDADQTEGLRRALIETRQRFPHYSMAVLCPTGDRARELEAAVHGELWPLDILSRVSDGEEAARLCDSYHVHFTTPRQAKGLEFDAVFVVDADAYDLNVPTEQAALYVALWRACHRLGIGARREPAGVLADLFAEHVVGA